jgi:phage FluMu protein Com
MAVSSLNTNEAVGSVGPLREKKLDPSQPKVLRSTTLTGGKMVVRDDQCRCACGSMLARVVREGLELKCRKCKGLILIRHEELVDMYNALEFESRPSMPKPSITKPPFPSRT